ncbi:MAG: methyltransferase domain-containing protein [Nitrosopumilus sp.]|nr:methyltransferase domain-containing protein [Nitrosopumilus sp.]
MTNPEDKSSFWNERYQSGEMGWDIGYPSTPIKEYFDQVENKELSILIPGAGNAYEAEYLHKIGFTDVTVLDFSAEAISSFQKRVPDFPEDKLIQQDFFEHKGQYDLIVEQTFFCALNPKLREQYVRKMYELMKVGGKLVGLLFDDELNNDRPPYGGSRREYKALFECYFTFQKFETAYNSIKPREGREIFFTMKKEKIVLSSQA